MPGKPPLWNAMNPSDAEFRRALSLTAYDALVNTERPSADALDALQFLMRRLASADPFTVKEEGRWITRLLDAGWWLTPAYNPQDALSTQAPDDAR